MRNSFTRPLTAASRAVAIALLATAFAVPQVRAQTNQPAPLRTMEDAIETDTTRVLMPTSQPGTLTFRNCAEPCKLRSLNVTSESQFFVGGTQVSLADFKAYLQRTGDQFMMVFRKPDGTDITRVIVYGQIQ